MFATTISRQGSSSRRTSARATSTSTSFARAVVRARPRPRRGRVDRDDGREPEPRRGDGEDARAAARVEQARRARVARQQLDAGARRRMRSRAERATGVDDDRGLAGGRRNPGRPDPQPAGTARAVELLPAVLPPGRDRLGDARRENARADVRLARQRPCTRRARCDPSRSTLLEAGREALEQPRARDLEPRRTGR